MAKRKRVTAKDVAERAGVSTATVSMILNGQGTNKFPAQTRRRVSDACSELGYIKGAAFGTSGVDDKVLVAITPSLSNLYYVHMVEAMQRRAKELGYLLVAFDTFREPGEETRIMQICNHFPFAGVFFLYPPENDVLLQQVSWKKPIVHIYDKDVHTDVDAFELDSMRVGKLIGEYLIKLGHERIAFITSSLATRQVARVRRLEGLQAAYAEHGFDPETSVIACSPETEKLVLRMSPEGYELGYGLAKRLLERGENVTAMAAVNDMVAIGAMDAITDAGKRIPQDYSVCGCDNVSASKYKGISLTTVECYGVCTGREAVDIMVRKMESGSLLAAPEEYPDGVTRVEYFPRLIIRRTTGVRKRSD